MRSFYLHKFRLKMAASEEGDQVAKIAKAVLIIFNIVLFVIGLGCIAVGIWMYADKYVLYYYIVLRRDYSDRSLSAAPGILIVAGIFCCLMAVLGFYAVTKKRIQFLLLYCMILLLCFILQLVVGFMTVVFKDQIHKTLKTGMRESIQKRYQFDNQIGKAWNWIQVRHKCCGVDGSWDYQGSAWFYGANRESQEGLRESETFVPNTCCVLDFNQDRDPRRVNPQDPRPKDYKRCQEDAQGYKVGGTNVHNRGCYARMLDFIHRHLNVLICFGLIFGFLQLVGIVAAAYMTYASGRPRDHLVTQQQPFVAPHMQQQHQYPPQQRLY